jgi:hypothetical protein
VSTIGKRLAALEVTTKAAGFDVREWWEKHKWDELPDLADVPKQHQALALMCWLSDGQEGE